ncbi:PAS domain-containing protein [Phormidium sp. LEGE 05292]|uniref:ATP-binding protein n=1 Tax=[Phormidium] sp. LEGE 05292 TaxID=767427 RepID=UPI0018812E17|nr:ATP-binding protein [Phormidium sp. LEGE 05292]MBE9227294.1 PAS domain-containing protein [Phormidium sp. LEGE 05292]
MLSEHLTIVASSHHQASSENKETNLVQPANISWVTPRKPQVALNNLAGLIYQFLLRKDGSLSFLILSPSFQEFFEMESAEMELDTDTMLSMIHPDDKEDFYNSISNSAKKLQSWRWVGRFILLTGKEKWIQWDAQPSLQANGNVFWNGLLVDVTSQQQLNDEVNRVSFLFGLTERLQSTTDVQEIAMFALNYLVQSSYCSFGVIKEIVSEGENSQAYHLVHHISAELVAKFDEPIMAEMEVILRRRIPQGKELLWQVVETGKPLFIEDYASHPHAIPEFYHPAIGAIGIFPIPAIDGSVIGVITLASQNFQNIQGSHEQELLIAACRILGARLEKAKDQERLARANADLELTSQNLQEQTEQLKKTLFELQQAQVLLVQNEKMFSLGQMVAGIAHEINNPIGFIQSNIAYARQYFHNLLNLLQVYQQHYPKPLPAVQLAIEETELNFLSQDLPKLISSMEMGAQRINEIIRSLRNFSRLDEAEIKLVDIHEGIDNTLLILNSRLRSHSDRPGIQVIKQYGDLPLIECYAGQLNQVFMNILTNAIDALQEQTNKGAEDRKNSAKYLHCHYPLPATNQQLPTIYIRTQILENSHIQIQILDNGPGIPQSLHSRIFDPFFSTKPVGKGTGLGLSISHRVIQEHGGSLKCFSAPQQGTEFIIEIPLQQSASSA